MEFLMNYGWTILFVLIGIGAITYFGVLNPDSFIPNRCDCYAVDMASSNTAVKNNITYVECIDIKSYLDYDAKRIRFREFYKLFYCDEDINQLIEVK